MGYYSIDQISCQGERVAADPMQAAFISYSREDSEFALRLARDLKAAGAAVWLDQLDIAPGQRWVRAVQEALNDCPRMLVVLSPASANSTNVEDEVSFVLEERKTVIPVLYRDCKIPFRLRPFQHTDFRSDYAQGLKELLRSLTSTYDMASATASASEFMKHPNSSPSSQISMSSLRGKWIRQTSGTEEHLFSVVFVSARSGWVVGDGGVILHTEDGGESWHAQTSGTRMDLRSVTFVSAQSGWAVGDGGVVLHTDDGGESWQAQSSGTEEDLRSVAFVAAESGWVVGRGGTILHTADEGKRWQTETSGTSEDLRSVTFVTQQSGFAVGGCAILHTADGGKSWRPQTHGMPALLWSAAFVSAQLGWAVGSTGGTILHTADGGTWTPQISGVTSDLASVTFATSESGWAVGAGGVILRTQDGGSTWKKQTSGVSGWLLDVDFQSPQTGWAVGENGTILRWATEKQN